MSSDFEIYILSTELQLINAINLICTARNSSPRICILIGRIATKDYLARLESTRLFRQVYLIDYKEPYLKNWLRDKKTNSNFSLFESLAYQVKDKQIEILQRHYFNLYTGLDDYLKSCCDCYFHNYNELTKPLLSALPTHARLHLLDEGVASYIQTTVPLEDVFAVHLYSPDLATFNSTENSKKIKSLKPISRESLATLRTLQKIYPTVLPLTDQYIYLDQPMGKNPCFFLRTLFPHYRREEKKYRSRVDLVKNLLAKNNKIVIRPHPFNLTNNQIDHAFGKLAKIQRNFSTTPFELELVASSLNHLELYTLYSTASCYWRIMFDRDLLADKDIKVHLLYLTQRNKILELIDPSNDELLKKFLARLISKYPNTFSQ